MVGIPCGGQDRHRVAARQFLPGRPGVGWAQSGVGVLPFDLETVEVRYHDKSYGKALPHTISRHAHPKARPETAEPEPPPTGIDYLALTATAHHEQLRRDERIGYHALYGEDGEIPGQLSIDNLQPGADVGAEGEVSA
ncbi:hypothetical protein MAGR_66710 [Mycolicibacterium agri]|uniref:Uncharacterized protein n=1 Tax=Mycolicibacterium agri TaxID=36811 RepID=A0A7I9WCR6_MYCAG|nr:hypothetical protein [Mycolicibacterium agri]GFG55230.1 hypothetical protein MAGR_66710 [Mycolicibacterium agri]